MSYHKVNQGSENGTGGTTHIAQLQAVPAYTRLIEEVKPMKINRANKSIPVAQDTYSGSEGIKEAAHSTNSYTSASPDNSKQQSSTNNGGVKVKNRSGSIDLFFDACEISNETNHVKVPRSETTESNLNKQKGYALKSTPIKFEASKSSSSEGVAGADSPPYSDDMLDSNSEVAASVAALRKAMEEAQARMKVAKELMRRKKEGFPDRVKRKSNIELKADGKREAKVTHRTTKLDAKLTLREKDTSLNSSSEAGRSTMRIEKARPDLGTKETCCAEEVVRETPKMKSDQAKHEKEVEQKESNDKGKILEQKEAENNKKEQYFNKTDRNNPEKPEESDEKIEMVREYWGLENNEEKVHADHEASAYVELVQETKHRSQKVVDETKLIQDVFENGLMDNGPKVDENGKVENRVKSFYKPEDYGSNVGGQGLIEGNGKKVAGEPEDGNKCEGSFELEECKINLRAAQEPREAEKNITEELKVSENKVDVFIELEECQLAEILEPLDNESVCSQHAENLTSMEEATENFGCLEDRKKINDSGFLDISQDNEHSCQREAREATGNTFGSIYVQEEIVDHIHSKKSKLNGEDMVLDAQASENGFEGAAQLMDGNTRERTDNKEPVEVIRVTLSDPCCEEVKAEKAGNTTETSSSYEPDETEKLNKTQAADIITENEETLEVNLAVHSYYEVDVVSEASSASFQQERYEETEPVQETSDFRDKHTDETYSFTQVAVELNEADNQIQNIFEKETSEGAARNSGDTDIKARQNIDQCWEKSENYCNLEMPVEDTTPESVEICKDAKETRDALKEDLDENRSNSSNGENLYDNEDIIDESQIPSTSDWKSSPFKEVEKVESSHINIRESNQVSAMEEKGANDNLHKEEQEKEHLKKLDAAKEREREREKEKLAVERAIREARERAFADARERAAVERAAAEARQKNISDGRERLGKTNSQVNEKTPAEKAAMEAKLKAERAAVERATAEARARALERALSERAASDARNKSDKPAAGFVASRDNAMKQNFHSRSFSHVGM